MVTGTSVTVTLAFASNEDAESSVTVVSTNKFASDLTAELRRESDFSSVHLTDFHGTVKAYDVVEIVDDTGVTSKGGGANG